MSDSQVPQPSDGLRQVLEQDARQAELERRYEADGRHERSHPMHALYTGLVAATTTTTTTTEETDDA